MAKMELDRFEENPRKNISLKFKLTAMIIGASILGIFITAYTALRISNNELISSLESEIDNTANGAEFLIYDWLDNLNRYSDMLSVEPSTRNFFKKADEEDDMRRAASGNAAAQRRGDDLQDIFTL